MNDIGKRTRDVTVTAKCVSCGHTREIKAGEVPANEMPMCDRCMSPMVAVRAQSRTGGGRNLD